MFKTEEEVIELLEKPKSTIKNISTDIYLFDRSTKCYIKELRILRSNDTWISSPSYCFSYSQSEYRFNGTTNIFRDIEKYYPYFYKTTGNRIKFKKNVPPHVYSDINKLRKDIQDYIIANCDIKTRVTVTTYDKYESGLEDILLNIGKLHDS